MTRGRRSRALLLLGTLGGFLLASVACEYPGVLHPLAAQAASAPAGAAAAAEPAPLPEPTPAAGQPLEGTVQVALKDFQLEPSALAVKAGAITFLLANQGRYTHDFRVEGGDVDERAPKVGAGFSRPWTITLSPGSYRISCPISNHADRGMNGTLTVAG